MKGRALGDVPLGGSPFPPIADYAFLSDCEVTALVAPSGNIEWMCLPRMDGPSRLRRAPGPRRGRLPPRSGRHEGPRRPALPARHDGPRDDVGHADGLGHRPRRPAHRPLAPRGRPLALAPPVPDRQRRRPRPAAHDALRQRVRRDAPGLRAGARLRPPARRVVLRGHGLQRRGRARPGRRPRGHADDRPAPRLRGRPGPRADVAARRRHGLRRALVDRARGPRRPTTRPTTASSTRPTSGTSGSRTATSPTTRGRGTCSAAR